MAQNFEAVLPLLMKDLKGLFAPTIKGWNRLEGRPRAKEFNRSLRAEIHDPLWMLTRQWQFGEFKGEDAGSPVDAQIAVRQTGLNQFIVNGEGRKYPSEIPLEVSVERDFLKKDILLQVQLFRHLKKLLAMAPEVAAIQLELLRAYPLDESAGGYKDRNTLQYLQTVRGKVADAYQLMMDYLEGNFSVIDGLSLASGSIALLKLRLQDLSQHYQRLYCQPATKAENAWQPSSLGYQFACAATSGVQEDIFLNATQYSQGHLDWFDFNIEKTFDYNSETIENPEPASIRDETLSFIPAPVVFGGMPASRYWEMENYKTEFADIDANSTDTVKLLLTEFALIYGNDWCVVPYEATVGSVIDLRAMVVTDCFGIKTRIRASGGGIDDAWQRWNMFGLNTAEFYADNRFFLAPALVKSLEGAAIEKVNFLRDEISNMVWAVTSVVTSAIGNGVDGYEAATALQNETPENVAIISQADLIYTLGKDVPLNWTPFLPSHVASSTRSIQLQRAKMPNASSVLRGEILEEPAPFFIHEEEVPRSGKVVSQSFQRTRGVRGDTFLWLGRKIQNGKGEGSSGLTFDQIEPKK